MLNKLDIEAIFNKYLLRQEKPNIDRKDVALMMYQRGLGILDLALCVDTEVRRQRICVERQNFMTFAGRGTSLGEGQDDADQDGQDASPR